MNKFGIVLGVAAVATLAGCKDPDYKRGTTAPVQNDVKVADTTPAPAPVAKPIVTEPVAKPIVVTEKHCTCRPGTKHTKPCGCGAVDCMCIVEVKPILPPEPEFTIYVVQNGDYLAKISKKYNVTMNSIKRLNNMKSDMVRVGQKLKLPGKIDIGAQPMPAVRPAATSAVKGAKAAKSAKKGYAPFTGATKEYVVKNGDSLGKIAYSNGLNIRQLKELNGLKTDALKIGQKLKVPVDAKAAKAAAPAAAPKAAAEAPKAPEKEASPAVEPAVNAEPTTPAPAANETAAPAASENAAPTPAAAPEAEKPQQATIDYVVKEGEDITRIAIDFGLSSGDLRELNNLGENDQVVPGQKIKLPADAQQQN